MAAAAATRGHGWTIAAMTTACHDDILSMRPCHFGVFLGFFGRLILLRCRRGDEQQPGADGDFNGEHGDRWRGPGFWRLIARCENGERDHDGERQEPAEDECGSFSYAALRGENQEERRERDRFERDRQTDEDEVKNHDRLGLAGEAARNL